MPRRNPDCSIPIKPGKEHNFTLPVDVFKPHINGKCQYELADCCQPEFKKIQRYRSGFFRTPSVVCLHFDITKLYQPSDVDPSALCLVFSVCGSALGASSLNSKHHPNCHLVLSSITTTTTLSGHHPLSMSMENLKRPRKYLSSDFLPSYPPKKAKINADSISEPLCPAPSPANGGSSPPTSLSPTRPQPLVEADLEREPHQQRLSTGEYPP